MRETRGSLWVSYIEPGRELLTKLLVQGSYIISRYLSDAMAPCLGYLQCKVRVFMTVRHGPALRYLSFVPHVI